MKSSILALALFAGVIGVTQSTKAESRGREDHYNSGYRGYDHHEDYYSGDHRDYDRDHYREYNWDNSYWSHHHFGYWHNHRGYWTYRDGQHIFISVD